MVYAELAREGTPSALTLLRGRARLVVTRTMSKAFALAGLRLGYTAADPALIDALRLVRMPYHLGTATQAVALAALRHTDLMLATVGTIKSQRDRLVLALAEMGLEPGALGCRFRPLRRACGPACDLGRARGTWCPRPRCGDSPLSSSDSRYTAGDHDLPRCSC